MRVSQFVVQDTLGINCVYVLKIKVTNSLGCLAFSPLHFCQSQSVEVALSY